MSAESTVVTISDGKCSTVLHPPDEPLSSSGFDHRVELSAGPLRGEIKAFAFHNAYKSFHDDLVLLYETLSGQVDLFGYENLQIKVIGDGCGHIDVGVVATADFYQSIELTYQIKLDQTQLPELIAAIKRTFVPMSDR
jgi:hypothetical protein